MDGKFEKAGRDVRCVSPLLTDRKGPEACQGYSSPNHPLRWASRAASVREPTSSLV